MGLEVVVEPGSPGGFEDVGFTVVASEIPCFWCGAFLHRLGYWLVPVLEVAGCMVV